MNKKLIVTGCAGLLSFAGMFAFAWLTKRTPAVTKAGGQQPSESAVQQTVPEPESFATAAPQEIDELAKRAMTERQLKNLIQEVRDKIREYEGKLSRLAARERRLQVAHGELDKDIERLESLRAELASAIAGLKQQRQKLEQSKIEIDKTERDNLTSIAATYDRMDPVQAGKILTNMSKTVSSGQSNANDAVKILYYMQERTRANVLAELASSEPALAAYFCQKLKRMVEEN